MWTVILATGVITETLYCAHTSLVYAHEILGQYNLYFFKWQPF